MKTFSGKLLKKIRIKRGLTQEKLARFINTQRSYIAALEINRYNPSANLIAKLADVLKVKEGFFFE